jgi:hypothetical protein
MEHKDLKGIRATRASKENKAHSALPVRKAQQELTEHKDFLVLMERTEKTASLHSTSQSVTATAAT